MKEEIDDIEFLLSCFEDMTDFKKELIIEQYKVENDKLLHPSLEFFDTVSEQQFQMLLTDPDLSLFAQEKFNAYFK